MFLKVVVLVMPLGLDCFAVAAALGAAGTSRRRRLRTSLLFAGFEMGMPIVGLLIGTGLGSAVGSVSDFVAIPVLIAVGVYMLALDQGEGEPTVVDLGGRHGWAAIALALSISLDELAIGLTLGLLRLPTIPVIILIGLQALVLSQLGLHLGAHISKRLREHAETAAGAALVLIGLGLLIEKVLA